MLQSEHVSNVDHCVKFIEGFESIVSQKLDLVKNAGDITGVEGYAIGVMKANGITVSRITGNENFIVNGAKKFYEMVKKFVRSFLIMIGVIKDEKAEDSKEANVSKEVIEAAEKVTDAVEEGNEEKVEKAVVEFAEEVKTKKSEIPNASNLDPDKILDFIKHGHEAVEKSEARLNEKQEGQLKETQELHEKNSHLFKKFLAASQNHSSKEKYDEKILDALAPLVYKYIGAFSEAEKHPDFAKDATTFKNIFELIKNLVVKSAQKQALDKLAFEYHKALVVPTAAVAKEVQESIEKIASNSSADSEENANLSSLIQLKIKLLEPVGKIVKIMQKRKIRAVMISTNILKEIQSEANKTGDDVLKSYKQLQKKNKKK